MENIDETNCVNEGISTRAVKSNISTVIGILMKEIEENKGKDNEIEGDCELFMDATSKDELTIINFNYYNEYYFLIFENAGTEGYLKIPFEILPDDFVM